MCDDQREGEGQPCRLRWALGGRVLALTPMQDHIYGLHGFYVGCPEIMNACKSVRLGRDVRGVSSGSEGRVTAERCVSGLRETCATVPAFPAGLTVQAHPDDTGMVWRKAGGYNKEISSSAKVVAS